MTTADGKKKGFSLIELMVAVTIFGLVAVTCSVEYSHHIKTKALNDTKMRSKLISDAFSRYLFTFGALPCPASPSLEPGSHNAGVGDCGTVMAQFPSYTNWQPNVSCDANNICVVQGARFTASNPTYCRGPAACGNQQPHTAQYKDPVIIGTLPYVDLGLALNDSVDGWGNRMTYAVSYYLTSAWVDPKLQCTPPTLTAHAFCSDFGVIAQESYSASSDAVRSTPNLGLSIGSPGALNSYMLAVVSHGPDGKGAWNYNGARPVPCDKAPIDTGAGSGLRRELTSTGRDNENCNGDAIFLANGDDANSNLTAFASGPSHYDDAFVLTDITIGVYMWRLNQQGNQMQSKSGGFVGIGTSAPTAPLDVQGSIQAHNYQSDTYCDKNTGNCFQQALLSPGLTCNNGLMTGVASSLPLCQKSIDLTGVTPATCPSGQYMTGLDKDGGLTCSAP